MGTMYTAAFHSMSEPGGSVDPMVSVPPLAERKINTSGTHPAPAAINNSTPFARLQL